MAPGDIWEKEGEEKDSSWLAIAIWRIKPMKDSLDLLVFDNSVSRGQGKSNFKHQNIQEAETVSSNGASHTKRFERKKTSQLEEFKFLFPKYLVIIFLVTPKVRPLRLRPELKIT